MRIIRLYQIMLSWCLLTMFSLSPMMAQKTPIKPEEKVAIRYVSTLGNNGNSGLNWNEARNDLQATINELYDFIRGNSKYSVGRIYVAEGTYVPTESTQETATGTLYATFKIKPGIEIYGGFQGVDTEKSPADREVIPGGKGWDFVHKTILSGSLLKDGNLPDDAFVWHEKANKYKIKLPRNSYHVVWFATEDKSGCVNGLDGRGRGISLSRRALIDGCTIQGGNSTEKKSSPRHHNSFGGGVYMVGNSVLRNCVVTKCYATLGGGGIYMDGGGRVESCYVHTNQCDGVGLDGGYGGGICLVDSGVVTHSLVVDNMARMGGGMALIHEEVKVASDQSQPINRFAIGASSCIVANNTSSTEAGGLLLLRGGVANQMTIVQNRCSGAEMIIRDRRYGLSGGAYIEECGVILNSILYGNEVGMANLQYAAHVSSSHQSTQAGNVKPFLYYAGVQCLEQTDWSGTERHDVLALYDQDTYAKNDALIIPNFIRVPNVGGKSLAGVQAGGTYSDKMLEASKGAPLTAEEKNQRYDFYWRLKAFSPLRTAGIRIESFSSNTNILHAAVNEDFRGVAYAAKSALGAYVPDGYNWAAANSNAYEGEETDVYTLFVDPNLKTRNNDDQVKAWGNSWDTPFLYLEDALQFIREVRKSGEIQVMSGTEVKTQQGDFTNVKFQIFVKEGTLTTGSNYYSGNLHQSHIGMESNVSIYGGFDKSLTGMEVHLRNVKESPTILSANVMKLQQGRCADHVVVFNGVSNAVLDGFYIERGYALPDIKDNNVVYQPNWTTGAGILIHNEKASGRLMSGIVVRNCKVSNCMAEDGAALSVHAAETGMIKVSFENCIFHNNSSEGDSSSVVLLRAKNADQLTISFDHCNILKNRGYPVKKSDHVKLTLTNSMIWANASVDMADSEVLKDDTDHLLRFNVSNSNLTVSHCAFDKETSTNVGDATCLYNLNYERNQVNFPTFVNSTKNIGAVFGSDQTYYGGRVDFTPRNLNPIVNAAGDDVSGEKTGGTDMTSVTTRDYGGAADIGAIENAELPKKGSVIYVRDYGNTTNCGGDGSSWATAINGNYEFKKNDQHFTLHPFRNVDAEIYREDMTGLQWAVDEAYYRSLKKNTKNAIVYKTVSEYTFYSMMIDEHSDPVIGFSSDEPKPGYEVVVGTIIKDGKSNANIRLSEVDLGNIVQVWVAEGEYLRRDGFFMRNSVDVYGGFPKTGNPGMTERNPKLHETIIETNSIADLQDPNFDEWGPLLVGGDRYKGYDFNSYYKRAYTSKRVLTQPIPYYKGTNLEGLGRNYHPTYIEWVNLPIDGFSKMTSWDGFTIQNGRTQIVSGRDGGAGVMLRHNGRIVNCVVKNNVNQTSHGAGRGGGVFCNGGVIENCIIQNNQLQSTNGGECMGGGLYVRVGTVFNSSFIANGLSSGGTRQGAAIFFEDGTFYNNTITKNSGGIAMQTGNWFSTGRVKLYNTIIIDNVGGGNVEYSSRQENRNAIPITMTHCLFASKDSYVYTSVGSDIDIQTGTFVEAGKSSLFNNPEVGDYTLKVGSVAINAGNDTPNGVTLPSYDANYDTRIQDCRVDIGAYEYNGAKDIKPTIYDENGAVVGAPTTDSHHHSEVGDKNRIVFFVSQNGKAAGNMSADYKNPACAEKLQKVLDAAGRFRYDLLTSNASYKNYEIVVRLAGDTQLENGEFAGFCYQPTRSVDPTSGNPRDYSFIIPHGITVEGGWNDTFTERKVTKYRTSLNGVYHDKGNDVDVYHVATFTNDVYSIGETVVAQNGLDKVTQRAVLDGLYLENGQATGEIKRHQKGGVAIVPGYGHIRNCILENNRASVSGGALHLQPRALVSGCLFKNNRAQNGGAVSVAPQGEDLNSQQDVEGEASDPVSVENMAHIYTSTLVDNTADGVGGALWFDNNVRANSSVFWNNKAGADMNISGAINPNSSKVDRVNTLDYYPLSYCAVEHIRVPGLNNIKVHSDNDRGVRFYEFSTYGLSRYSRLCRAGMSVETYSELVESIGLAEADFMNVVRGDKAVSEQGKVVIKCVKGEWSIDGFDLGKSDVEYDDGGLWVSLPVIAIENDGYWYLDNKKTSVESGRKGNAELIFKLKKVRFQNLWFINGQRTNISSSSVKNLDVVIEVGDNGNWWINHQDTGIAADFIKEYYVSNEYIDIGARAFDGELLPISYNKDELLTRLYVAPMNVDWSIAKQLETSGDKIYSQEGSSFALPMKTLDAALSYIRHVRERGVKDGNDFMDINNQRFEIILAAGYYYPTEYKDETLVNNAANASFHVPHGVSIVGGMNNRWSENDVYEGQIGKPYQGKSTDFSIDSKEEVINVDTMMSLRSRVDQNANGIIEPWEMEQQTILSGEVVTNEECAYHIVTCLPYPLQGNQVKEQNDTKKLPTYDGTRPEYLRPDIFFDGIEFESGDASSEAEDSPYSLRGAAILVAGNMEFTPAKEQTPARWKWVGPTADKETMAHAVGRYNIPLTLSNCRFNGNIAREGGAVFTDGELFVYSSSFERNLAKGVNGKGKGGAVASNYETTFINTIFQNNQAGADETKGQGGAYYAGKQAWSHVLNCNVVKNLADDYPAFYFGTPNYKKGGMQTQSKAIIDADAKGADRHMVINSVFWGNEVKDSGVSFVVNYAKSESERDLQDWQAISADDCYEALWFCGYEIGKGRRPKAKLVEGIDVRQATFVQNATHYMPKIFENYLNKASVGQKLGDEDKSAICSSNYNVYIDKDNTLLNGPNFSKPSELPGVVGYDASSSWLVTRPNSLTDNGWSYLKQQSTYNPDSESYDIDFERVDGNFVGGGIYPVLYDENKKSSHYHKGFMALGKEVYMKDLNGRPIYRICLDPDPTATGGFIDIGVYEYRKIPLKPVNINQVDVLWVCETQNTDLECDGSSAARATSNVQQAIETLLSSRNGHHKEIRFLGGNYAPKFTMVTNSKNNLGFFFNTANQDNSAVVPKDVATEGKGLAIGSFSFRGGWSDQGDYRDLVGIESRVVSVRPPLDDASNVQEEGYKDSENAKNAKHLFFIEDALQRKSYYSGSGIQSKPTGDVVPIIFDGLIMTNDFASAEEGNAIYYAPQYKEGENGVPTKEQAEVPNVEGYISGDLNLPKLAISRCKFSANGVKHKYLKPNVKNAVVTISEGGGRAIVYNSLFHSNQGAPLRSVTGADNATDVVNCTFALNQYGLELNENSSVINSVLWRNHPLAKGFGYQLKLGAEEVIDLTKYNRLQYNALTGLDVNISDQEAEQYKYNVGLSDNNVDLIYGPNFANPLETEGNVNEQTISDRDFSILPSIRLLNSGSKDLYGQTLFKHCQFGEDQRKVDSQLYPSYEVIQDQMENNMAQKVQQGDSVCAVYTDLENESRLVAGKIDRGAYEYMSQLYRVVYVDPAKANKGLGTGWTSPYNAGQVQNAIDMAAVYAHNVYQAPNGATGKELEDNAHAYVLIKGNENRVLNRLIMRAGVSIYGSIDNVYNSQITEDEAKDNVKLSQFIDQMRYSRPGMVQPRVQRTLAEGISVDTECRGHRALIDGVEIKGIPAVGNMLQEVTSPVVDLSLTFSDKEATLQENTQLVMRNCIVDGFYNTSQVPTSVEAPSTAAVVRVDNALCYNLLTFNNKVNYNTSASATTGQDQWVGTVQVGENGYLENCTVVACDFDKDQPDVPAFYMPGTSANHNVHNTYIYPGNIMEIVGEGEEATPTFRPRANTFCKYFDTTAYLAAFGEEPYLRYQLQETSGEINAGSALQTKLPEKYRLFIDHVNDRDLLGNPRKLGAQIDNGCFETWKVENHVALKVATDKYGADAHYYPHEGSVVYLSAPMVVSDDFVSEHVTEIRPGYFLLEENGGWYGQGKLNLRLRYAAVERSLGADNLLSLPFNYDYLKGSERWDVDPNQKRVLVPFDVQNKVYTYNGEKRADSDFLFSERESLCWDVVDKTVMANHGVLYQVPSGSQGVHRFTALGNTDEPYVYSEDVAILKKVTLQQYNQRTLDDSKPIFTAKENMGWNLVGMPYMVSRYATGPKTEHGEDYQMGVPHVIYQLNNDGGYDVMQSWAPNTFVKMGGAFFTQTAVIEHQGQELVSFALPDIDVEHNKTTSNVVALRSEAGVDHLTVCPSAEANSLIYRLNTDGLKWMAFNEDLPQLYLANEAGTRFSLAAAAPVATELKLGVYAPKEGSYTFGLPGEADFGDFTHVWLTDREEGIVTDLKAEDYTVALTAALDSPERFTLKFGGTAPILDDALHQGQYQVFIRGGQLYVRGLQGGEHIRVYDMMGRDVLSVVSTGREFKSPLQKGIYVVKVNGNVYKVR